MSKKRKPIRPDKRKELKKLAPPPVKAVPVAHSLTNTKTTLKRCARCETNKPVSDFGASKSWCKQCVQEYNKYYYIANKDRHYELVLNWEATHKPERKAINQKYRQKTIKIT